MRSGNKSAFRKPISAVADCPSALANDAAVYSHQPGYELVLLRFSASSSEACSRACHCASLNPGNFLAANQLHLIWSRVEAVDASSNLALACAVCPQLAEAVPSESLVIA